MKNYKALNTHFSDGSLYSGVYKLVNIEDHNDFLFAGKDEFQVGEVLPETKLDIKTHLYNGVNIPFAFKKVTFSYKSDAYKWWSDEYTEHELIERYRGDLYNDLRNDAISKISALSSNCVQGDLLFEIETDEGEIIPIRGYWSF